MSNVGNVIRKSLFVNQKLKIDQEAEYF